MKTKPTITYLVKIQVWRYMHGWFGGGAQRNRAVAYQTSKITFQINSKNHLFRAKHKAIYCPYLEPDPQVLHYCPSPENLLLLLLTYFNHGP